MHYAIKTGIKNTAALEFSFLRQKTMYGGKHIKPGDTAYLFASEKAGGRGLFARAAVLAATPAPPDPNLLRQTPRVSVSVRLDARASHPLGRAELRLPAPGPAAELHFKFYRQATDKIAALSDEAACWLQTFFPA